MSVMLAGCPYCSLLMHSPESSTFFNKPVVMTGTWRAHSCPVENTMMVRNMCLTVRDFVAAAHKQAS